MAMTANTAQQRYDPTLLVAAMANIARSCLICMANTTRLAVVADAPRRPVATFILLAMADTTPATIPRTL